MWAMWFMGFFKKFYLLCFLWITTKFSIYRKCESGNSRRSLIKSICIHLQRITTCATYDFTIDFSQRLTQNFVEKGEDSHEINVVFFPICASMLAVRQQSIHIGVCVSLATNPPLTRTGAQVQCNATALSSYCCLQLHGWNIVDTA